MAPSLSWNTAKYFQTPGYVKDKQYLLSATSPDTQFLSKSMNRNASTGQLLFSTPMYKRKALVPLEQDLYKSSGDPFHQDHEGLMLGDSARLLTTSRYAQGILSGNLDQ